MAFGAANFDVAEAIAIARAAQLAQKQKEAAERVATACGGASSSGQGPQGSQPKKKKERRHRAGGLEGYGGASSSSSSAEEDGEKEIDLAKFVGAQGNFALQRGPRGNSPSAPPPDARKAAQDLGLRLCRRGRRAPKPQAAQASSPAEDLASCFPKPGEPWAPHYAGEGGRAPVLPEQAEAAPPEWRQGLPGTRHRLGVPPLRRRGPDAAAKQPEQAQEEGQEREKEERSWSHQAFAVSQDMWFGSTGDGATPGVPPLLRYRPQSTEAAEFVPPSRSGQRQAELAPRKPGASVAGQTNWHWERQRDEADQWEAEAPEPAAATKPLPEPAPAPKPGVNHLAKAPHSPPEAPQLSTAPTSPGASPAEAKEAREAPHSPPEAQQLSTAPTSPGASPAEAEEAREAPELATEPEGSGAAPAEAKEAYEAPLEVAEDGPLEVGDRVVVVGLKSRPEMNGMVGTLVKMKDEQRWQVVMDEDFSEKIFKAKNLERLSGTDGPEDVD